MPDSYLDLSTATWSRKPHPLPHVSPLGLWVSKLWFRFLSTIFAISVLSLTGAIAGSSHDVDSVGASITAYGPPVCIDDFDHVSLSLLFG